MAEKTREQWRRAVRRWSVVGAVVGTVAGCVVLVLDGSVGALDALGGVLAFLLMGAGMGLVLWGSAYRHDFVRVWGWRALGLTSALLGLLIAGGVGLTCLLGACGER